MPLFAAHSARIPPLACTGCVTIAGIRSDAAETPRFILVPDDGLEMHNPFMARAIELSLGNIQAGRGGPFAAVVVKDGRIIAEGTNRVTSTNDPTAHAEVLAIREACKKLRHFELKDCEIYTTCEPCPMCLGAIYWARPARVYFASTAADASAAGFDDSFIYREIEEPHSRRKIPMIQLMREEALTVFRSWEKKKDKIQY